MSWKRMLDSREGMLVGVAGLALLALAVSAGAQAGPRRPGGGFGMGPGLGGLAGVPGELLAPVPNAPLSANATVTYGQGQQNTVELARDANGRTYIKTTLPARPHRDGAQDNSANA